MIPGKLWRSNNDGSDNDFVYGPVWDEPNATIIPWWLGVYPETWHIEAWLVTYYENVLNRSFNNISAIWKLRCVEVWG